MRFEYKYVKEKMKKLIFGIFIFLQMNFVSSIDISNASKISIDPKLFKDCDIVDLEEILNFSKEDREKLLVFFDYRIKSLDASKAKTKFEVILDDLEAVEVYSNSFGSKGRGLVTLSEKALLIIVKRIVENSLAVNSDLKDRYTKHVKEYLCCLRTLRIAGTC